MAKACRVRVDIDAAIDPGPAPSGIVDEDRVATPVEAVVAPAPGPKSYAKRYAEIESDRAADEKSRAWGEENDSRIVIRDYYESRVYRRDGDVGPVGHHDLRIRSEIAVAVRYLALPLHRVHYFRLLREERITQFTSPGWIAGHHVQNVRKRQKSLHAGIPRQLIGAYSSRQRIAGEVVVLIGPTRRLGNLIRISRGGHNLREQRVGVERDAGNQAIQLGRGKVRRSLLGVWRRLLRVWRRLLGVRRGLRIGRGLLGVRRSLSERRHRKQGCDE